MWVYCLAISCNREILSINSRTAIHALSFCVYRMYYTFTRMLVYIYIQQRNSNHIHSTSIRRILLPVLYTLRAAKCHIIVYFGVCRVTMCNMYKGKPHTCAQSINLKNYSVMSVGGEGARKQKRGV